MPRTTGYGGKRLPPWTGKPAGPRLGREAARQSVVSLAAALKSDWTLSVPNGVLEELASGYLPSSITVEDTPRVPKRDRRCLWRVNGLPNAVRRRLDSAQELRDTAHLCREVGNNTVFLCIQCQIQRNVQPILLDNDAGRVLRFQGRQRVSGNFP